MVGVDMDIARGADEFMSLEESKIRTDLQKADTGAHIKRIELSRLMGKVTGYVRVEYGVDYIQNTWIPAFESSGSVDDLPADVKDVLDSALKEVGN